MLTVGQLEDADFERRLTAGGLTLHWGPFSSRVTVRLPELVDPLRVLYADCRVSDEPLADFHALVRQPCSLVPQACWRAEFLADGERVLGPSPRAGALAMFEWGLNWCVYSSAHRFLMVHAAVVAKDDEALVLPGAPGSGKSTLTAALVADGWRLLSDELTLIEPASGLIQPIARPISLKNESIALAQRLLPGARFSPTVKATPKGRLALMRPPVDAVRRSVVPTATR
jgi:HprK-related kinase A